MFLNAKNEYVSKIHFYYYIQQQKTLFFEFYLTVFQYITAAYFF